MPERDPWSIKFNRETPFMAFGSMMNAFGRINEGKEFTMEEFEKITNKIFELAKKYVDDAFANAAGGTGANVDIPIKN